MKQLLAAGKNKNAEGKVGKLGESNWKAKAKNAYTERKQFLFKVREAKW